MRFDLREILSLRYFQWLTSDYDSFPSVMACLAAQICTASGALSNKSKNEGQSFIDCSPRPRGQGGRHGLEWTPSPMRVTPRGTPEDVILYFFTYLKSFNRR